MQTIGKFGSLLVLLLITSISQATEFNSGAPDGATKTIDAKGNVYENFLPLQQAEGTSNALMAGTWWDNGYGPGVLGYQYQLYYSDVLSTTSASGFMTEIHYQWSGSFNGWSDTRVYLLIVNPTSGAIVANAEVTSATSGSLTPPSNTYPGNYAIAYGYVVDRPPLLSIFNGPSFGIVSVTVEYQ